MPLVAWFGLLSYIAALLAVESLVSPRRFHVVGLREAELLGLLWFGAAVVAGLAVAGWLGPASGIEYATAYAKSLDIGHIFAFALIMGAFAVPRGAERRALFWGVPVALAIRLAVILAGTALVADQEWVLYLFGVFLVASGIHVAASHDVPDDDPLRHPAVRLARRVLPISGTYQGDRFVARVGGALVFTPLVLVLVSIEVTDLLFSADSLAGLLALSPEPFVIFSANALATIGLRALYFVAADLRNRVRYWRIGLAATLLYVGVKLLLGGVVKIDPLVSLAIISGILGLTILVSWLATLRERRSSGGAGSEPLVDGGDRQDGRSDQHGEQQVRDRQGNTPEDGIEDGQIDERQLQQEDGADPGEDRRVAQEADGQHRVPE